MVVDELLGYYNRNSFEHLTLEFRNEDNFLIKIVQYGDWFNYITNENLRNNDVKEFFFSKEDTLVIIVRVGDE